MASDALGFPAAWLEQYARRGDSNGPTVDHASYIGGSDIAAILDCDPFRTPLDVWAAKRRLSTTTETEPVIRGRESEAGIIAGFTRRLEIDAADIIATNTILIVAPDGERPGIGATPDAIARIDGELVTVQAKLVGIRAWREWGEDGDPDGVPEHVILQVHHEAAVVMRSTGETVRTAYAVAAIGTDLRIYPVAIDLGLCDRLIEIASDFAERVSRGEMPAPTGREGCATMCDLYPRHGATIEETRDESVCIAVRDYADARREAKAADAKKAAAAEKLRALIGSREGFRGDGWRATWKAQTKKTPKWKAIAKELGIGADVIAKHTEETSTRVLRVTVEGSDDE